MLSKANRCKYVDGYYRARAIVLYHDVQLTLARPLNETKKNKKENISRVSKVSYAQNSVPPSTTVVDCARGFVCVLFLALGARFGTAHETTDGDRRDIKTVERARVIKSVLKNNLYNN